MKKAYLFLSLMLVSLQALAWTSPIDLPDAGNARIYVVGQNAQNYLCDFTASNSSCASQEEFDEKTDKMANVFLALKADIVAICEVEQNGTILQPICDAMNRISGLSVFTYVTDDIEDATQSASGYLSLKAGFIYRSDKVAPYGTAVSPYNTNSGYFARLRIQAFKEISTNEVFVLSMNHFKAKDSSDDAGEGTRLTNVSRLLSKLNTIGMDPDIMIMGDLNAYMGEQPILNLQNAGYEEQLIRFDPNAYSYVYYGEPGLLDHAMANAPMAAQVSGAQVYHINTSGLYSYKYSDHDAYVVGLNLGDHEVPVPVECPHFTYNFQNGFEGFQAYTVSGDAQWKNSSSYGMTINAYYNGDNQEHWLISPSLDMHAANSAELTIYHSIYYDNGVQGDYVDDQTVWVSTDYEDGEAPYTANWHQVVLSDYAVKSWVDATAQIPAEYLGANTHVAFRYTAAEKANCNYWEIKQAEITATCTGESTAIEQTVSRPAARKIMHNGQLYIEYNGILFDCMGRMVR